MAKTKSKVKEEAAPDEANLAEETQSMEKVKTPDEKKAERLAANEESTAVAEEAVEALATVGDSSMSAFNPQDFNKAWALAQAVAKSGVVAAGIQGNAGSTFAVMARGALMGIHWSVAVTEAYVVNGRVGWPAAVMEALIDRSPAFEFFEVLEAADTYAVVEAKKHRWSEPRTYRVTLEEAKKAGYLDGKHSEMWLKRPKLMLIAMARREAARMWDPGRMAGVYSVEEIMAAGPRALAEMPRVTATAALESLAGGSENAEVVEAEEVLEEPPNDSRRLSPKMIRKLIAMMEQANVSRSDLEHRLGVKLENLEIPDGKTESDEYTRILGICQSLSKSKR